MTMQARDLEVQIIEAAEPDADSTVLRLRNRGAAPLGSDWRLYVSFGLTPLDTDVIHFTSIEGRFGFLAPAAGWRSLESGASVDVPIRSWIFAGNRLIDRQGFLLTVLDGNRETTLGAPVVTPAELLARDESAHGFIAKASPRALTEVMTPERGHARFDDSETRAVSQVAPLPRPKSVSTAAGDWQVDRGSAIEPGPFGGVADCLAPLGDAATRNGVPVGFELDGTVARDGYTLDASPRGVVIKAASQTGAYYGAQSLLQLAATGAQPSITIRDQPRFAYRAVYLDIARHFPTLAPIERLIRAMGRYKLNVLVLGISNDEGWRLEVPGIPELTAVGSTRRFDPQDETPGALPPALGDDVGAVHEGYLTRDAFVSLLRFAAAHCVELILEFNLPGHANALIRALASTGRFDVVDPLDRSAYASHQGYARNTVNPCMAGTYDFAREVIAGFKRMYDEAGVPFKRLHCGGDETPEGTWLRSPACEMTPGWDPAWNASEHASAIRRHVMTRHFRELSRVARDVAPGVELGFWHEMARYVEAGAEGVWLNDWTTHRGQDSVSESVAASALPVVVSNASYLYFDMPHVCHPDEPGLPWATYVDTRGVLEFEPADLGAAPGSVMGLQAQLWSETVYTPQLVDFYLFPRLLAFAERCWSEPGSRGWPAFASAADRELAWLDERSIAFRIAPPGVIVRDGLAHAVCEFPSLEIRYSAEGDPSGTSPVYDAPIPIGGGLWFSAWFRGRASRSVFVAPDSPQS